MKAFLLLGRLGDLTTVLPAVREEHKATGQKVPVVVAKEFACLLEGVSYAEPVIWDGPFERVMEARSWAQRKLPQHQLVDCSVYGYGINPSHDMWSFTREIWRLSKSSIPYEQAELVFDRRSPEREQQLLERCVPETPRRHVLFAGAGHSSPFAQAPEVFSALRERLPEFDVVDISNVRAERPYDLLGLYEKAAALVATDSFPLHLAQATPHLPVVALVPDGPTPWHRSAWRPNHFARFRYSEALGRMEDIVRTIRQPRRPKIFFVTSGVTPTDPNELRRLQQAKGSREQEFKLGGWSEVVFAPARSGLAVGDKAVPYVRDMFEQGLAAVTDERDIVVVCNHDIGFTPGMTGQLIETVQRCGCAFAHRWDFSPAALTRPVAHELDVKRGRFYLGSDLFACTPRWWKTWQSSVPDFLLGREAWDMVMRNAMKRSYNPTDPGLERAIWHVTHQNQWSSHSLRLPGNEHNKRLAGQWFARFGGGMDDWQRDHKYRG